MNKCKTCGKTIDEKYEYCWTCNEKMKKIDRKRLQTFTCSVCGQTMHSMIWPGKRCCCCYAYRRSPKNTCSTNSINRNAVKNDFYGGYS